MLGLEKRTQRGRSKPSVANVALASLLCLAACARGLTDTEDDGGGGMASTSSVGGMGGSAGGNVGGMGGAAQSSGVGGNGGASSSSSSSSSAGGAASSSSSGAGGSGPRPPMVGELVITEFMANPMATSDASGEWLEIANVSADELDLSGCRLLDLNSPPDEALFPASLSLMPGARGLFAKNSNSSQNGGISGVLVAFGTDYTLANSDDEIIVECGGTIIDQVNYGGNWPYAAGVAAQLAGNSLSAAANDQATNWCAATSAYGLGDLGTPGADTSACP